jgi:hypothetical protein
MSNPEGYLQANIHIWYRNGQKVTIDGWITDITSMEPSSIGSGVPRIWGFKAIESQDNCQESAEYEGSAIHHPSHYGGDVTYEAIKVITAWNLTFNTGNSAKYICRAGKKGGPEKHIEDLEKAREYLTFEIERLKKLQAESKS